MAPSGVQKERMQPEDMFILDPQGAVLHTPSPKAPPARPPKLSECSPLFMAVSSKSCMRTGTGAAAGAVNGEQEAAIECDLSFGEDLASAGSPSPHACLRHAGHSICDASGISACLLSSPSLCTRQFTVAL